jgi:hypothetical protein
MSRPRQIEILGNTERKETLCDLFCAFFKNKENIRFASSVFIIILFTAITIIGILYLGGWAIGLWGPLIAVAGGAA